MNRSKYKKVTNQSISEIEVDQNFDQIMTHLNSKNPDQPITFPEDTEIVLPKLSLEGILELNKDKQGIVGLEIPGLLSINNQEYQAGQEVLGTEGNLCLLKEGADYLKKEDVNIVPLTPYNESIDIFIDSNELIYYINDSGSNEGNLYFYGGVPPSNLNITVAPNWTEKDMFLYSDVSGRHVLSLDMVLFLNFETLNDSRIIVPKTVSLLFKSGHEEYGSMKNFSGTLDIHYCDKLLSETIETRGFENCTTGTLLVNQDQWDSLESRISNGMLDGKIKIQKAGEEGNP